MDERAGRRDHVIVVRRTADGHELVRDDGVEEVATGSLPAVAARLEAEAPRWAWDTADVYPALLDAGVRVARAWDLRLGRALLRRAAGTRGAIAALPVDGWDAVSPAAADGALPLDLGADLDPVAEHARQADEIAVAQRPGALRLLLTAESAGALAAAEMRFAGLPWRRAEHERILVELLGPRGPADRRPAVLERLADEVRAALGRPR